VRLRGRDEGTFCALFATIRKCHHGVFVSCYNT
jgi:hypothetical protein